MTLLDGLLEGNEETSLENSLVFGCLGLLRVPRYLTVTQGKAYDKLLDRSEISFKQQTVMYTL